MARYREPFTLFKRHLASGKLVYYYTVYDPLNKRKQYSTGKSSYFEAKRYCLKLFKGGNLVQKERTPTLREYTKEWFIYDRCPYVGGKMIRGFTFSRSNLENRRRNLENRVLPWLGHLPLNKIKPAHIEKWLLELSGKGFSTVTLNQFLNILKLILGEACRLEEIERNPAQSVKPFAQESKKKGTLTETESKRLFETGSLESIWGGNRLCRLANLTASLTGMRMGEVQALREENLHPDYIVVKHSWDRKYGLKGTKNGKERTVPIPASLYNELMKMSRDNTCGAYLFSQDRGVSPVGHTMLQKSLSKALNCLGISEEERKERGVSFHSWRYLFNSRLRAKGLPDGVVRALVGHNSDKMTERYTAFNQEDFAGVLEVIEGMV